jgi:hypothetical protein
MEAEEMNKAYIFISCHQKAEQTLDVKIYHKSPKHVKIKLFRNRSKKLKITI